MPVFIDDGYTKDGEVAAFGDFPGVKFQYRPALARAVYDYGAADKSSGAKVEAATLALLTRHVVGWDAPDPARPGEPAAVTPELLKRLPHRALEQMVSVVMGYSAEQQAADVKN